MTEIKGEAAKQRGIQLVFGASYIPVALPLGSLEQTS
jgi:hypothetical protein